MEGPALHLEFDVGLTFAELPPRGSHGSKCRCLTLFLATTPHCCDLVCRLEAPPVKTLRRYTRPHDPGTFHLQQRTCLFPRPGGLRFLYFCSWCAIVGVMPVVCDFPYFGGGMFPFLLLLLRSRRHAEGTRRTCCSKGAKPRLQQALW